MQSWKTRMTRWIIFSTMIVAVGLFAGCEKDDDDDNQQPTYSQTADFNSDVAQEWMGVLLDRIKAEGLNPPFASRMIGYTGVTMYESCVDGMPNNISLTGQLTDLSGLPSAQSNTEYHWPSVVNSATAAVLTSLFVGKDASIQAIAAKKAELHTEYAAAVDADVLTRSEAYGDAVATAVIAWIAGDNYAVAITNCSGYAPSGLPGRWAMTPRNNGQPPLPALLPCWGEMRHFLMADISTDCDPGACPPYSTEVGSAFRTEIDECYNSCVNATSEMTAIAFFWSDDPTATFTPPGHWVAILKQLAADHDYDLAKVAEAFAGLGVSQADAFTACWETKYEYDLLRPITVIRELYAADWFPPLNTPNFPEYTSGHSVQSGAASTVLEYFLGDVSYDDHTHENDLTPRPARHFDTFEEAANEAGISRMYGGIHFRSAIDNGLEQGRCIGDKVVALQFRANS